LVRFAAGSESHEAKMRNLRAQVIRALESYTPERAAALQPLLDGLQRMCQADAGLVRSIEPGGPPEGRAIDGGNGESTDSVPLVPLSRVVKRHIVQVYQALGCNKTRAARVLEIDVKTLYNKLKRYGMR
jgi:DNA-binding NtrC family response regulator